MHACYGLGAFVSPMIAEPFILDADCSVFIGNGSSLPLDGHPTIREPNVTNPHSLEEAQQASRVKYAFWIMGTTQVITNTDT